jgi:hypothetical protein
MCWRRLNKRSGGCLLLALTAGAITPAAKAHRPFDVADASVAEASVLEAELGARRLHHGTSRLQAAPLAFTLGLDGDTELGFAARSNRAGNAGGRRRLGEAAIAVKHLFRHGGLQDAAGVSVAGECALLLPDVRSGEHSGAMCAAIVSQRFAAADIHVNAALTRSRDQQTLRYYGVAAEGPQAWVVRPAAEFGTERAADGAHVHSVLVGLAWQASPDVSLGFALRKVGSGAGDANEARIGLTWVLRP